MSSQQYPFEKTIEQLLMRHECVILPGFGGFIVRDSPCNFNAAKDQVKPFARHIFFNPHLLQNDGLLSGEISKLQDISFSKANDVCSEAIASLKLSIESAGSSVFGNLGTFFKGQENIWFAPSTTLNLALESYGLSPVDIHPIQIIAEETKPVKVKESNKKAIELPSADKKPIENIEFARPGLKPWLVAASVALLVHFIYLKTENFNNTDQHQASVLPVITSAPSPVDSSTIEADNTVNEEVVEQPVISELSPEPSPEVEKPVIVQEEVLPEPTQEIVNNEVVAETQSPLFNKTAKYKMESNANYHMKDLIKLGKSARVELIDNWYWVIVEEVPVQ